jgi:Ca2+-binding RTX toxin-like protein
VALIYGTNWPDYLVGTNYSDTIYGFGGDDILEGWYGNDWLFGGNGSNYLWGGPGYDVFATSARSASSWSDDWIADFTFDVDLVDLSAWGVSDFGQVRALLEMDGWGNATLNAFYAGLNHIITFEGIDPDDLIAADFIYSASGPKNQTGTQYADVLFGSRYGDILNGGYGDDTLLGGRGDDFLMGDRGIDFFDGGAGFDEVSFAYTNEAISVDLNAGLAVFATGPVEQLVSIESVTGGGGNDSLVGDHRNNAFDGGAGNDAIDGGDGDDLIDGGRGADILFGGYGYNSFLFDTTLGGGNVDTIADFYAPWDTIQLARSIFTGLPLGVLSASRYAEGNFSSAQDSTDRIVYNNATGGLFYDRDGIGGVAAVKFADLAPGLASSLSNFDFLVV